MAAFNSTTELPQNNDRSHFTTSDSIRHIWSTLDLPLSALISVHLPESDSSSGLPSSFKIGHLAQASIALSALTAALFHSLRNDISVPRITVPLRHAVTEFKSERLYTLNGKPMTDPWGPFGGLHKTADGYVRIHDNFPNHLYGTLRLLGLPKTATREEGAAKVAKWRAVELESKATENKLVIAALRSFEEWDVLPQAKALSELPIIIRKIAQGEAEIPPHLKSGHDKCLRGVKVLELSRVIAAPVAGKTLAAHGADVLWVTSPNLPDLPALDRDLARGKRTIQLDLTIDKDRSKLRELAKEADIFIQGYRPGGLTEKGFSPEDLAALNPGIIYASMSAYGSSGPWSQKRGFDSLVQTCSGMNVSEAAHLGEGEVARPTPCQALDHASGYFLAAGVSAALCKRAIEGGSWSVEVSLAGTGKYLRSLGQFKGPTGFECEDLTRGDLEDLMETRECGFGVLRAVKHSAEIQGLSVGWDIMPKKLGCDEAEWL